KLREIQNRMVDLALQGKVDESVALLADPASEEIINKRTTALMDLYALESRMNESAADAAARSYRSAQVVMTAVAVLALVLAVIAAFLVTRSITRPIGSAVGLAQRLAEGDLTVTVDASAADEVGDMLKAMRNMVEKLSMVVTDVNGSAEALASA